MEEVLLQIANADPTVPFFLVRWVVVVLHDVQGPALPLHCPPSFALLPRIPSPPSPAFARLCCTVPLYFTHRTRSPPHPHHAHFPLSSGHRTSATSPLRSRKRMLTRCAARCWKGAPPQTRRPALNALPMHSLPG